MSSRRTVSRRIDNQSCEFIMATVNFSICKFYETVCSWNARLQYKSPHQYAVIAMWLLTYYYWLFRKICKMSCIPMDLSVSVWMCVVSTGHTMAKIEMSKMTFVDFDICRRMASLQKYTAWPTNNIYHDPEVSTGPIFGPDKTRFAKIGIWPRAAGDVLLNNMAERTRTVNSALQFNFYT